ncbi:MAG: NAD(P)H-quinone oxidoreductase [Pseudomonadota bacterium]|nr:NAD(P)H-quinone oxidoreductase [Pseudomonadota bacterium]
MRAVIVPHPGGPEALTLVERPVPMPGAGEILIKVAAAGVNRPDVLQRLGGYAPPPGASDVLGLEVAGDVVALGEGVAMHIVGDPVAALLPGGGYAEYALAHESNALPAPQSLSMVEAAAIPETYFTVWTNVFERGGLKAGEWLLVHGGASGIGTTAIQLAKAFGAHVIATVGADDKAEACRRLGADVVVNYNKEDFVAAARAASGKGVDVILDMVGGDYVQRNYAAAAMDGRIVQIAFLKGATTQVDLRPLMMKRLVHTGSTLRPRSPAEKALIAEALREQVWPLLDAGRAKPIIDSTFPLDSADKAHARMESSGHFGKIVLTI